MFLYTVTFYCPSSSVGLFFLDHSEVAALPPLCGRLAGVVTEKLGFITAAGGLPSPLESYHFQALLSILGKVREPLEHWKVAFLIFTSNFLKIMLSSRIAACPMSHPAASSSHCTEKL